MPRLTSDTWQSVRAEYESGASQGAVAKKYGVSRAAVQKRLAKEGWSQDAEPVIRRQVAEKVAQMVAGGDPAKRAAAIDAEAGRRAAVVLRHREQFQSIYSLVEDGLAATRDAGTEDNLEKRKMLKADAFDTLKAAKIASETFNILQKSERLAWGLDEKENPVITMVAQLFSGRLDVRSMTIEQLRELRGQLE